MKRTDNRQNKNFQTRIPAKPVSKEGFRPIDRLMRDMDAEARKGGTVLGLVADMMLASKIAQASRQYCLDVHNFDKAAPLIEQARTKKVRIVILDWDACEAEAFKVLKQMGSDADLSKVPSVGYLSNSKIELKSEAQRAGCHRVYGKSEFLRDLSGIIARYAS